MIVTKIEVQKKNKQRVNLYLDNEFYCGLSVETIMKNRIKEGQDLSLDLIDFLKNQTEKEIALSKAVSYISKSQKTLNEITKYLITKGFDEEVCNYVIEKMKEYNFINDELYAKNYIKFKNKNSGKKKIVLELKQKGLDDNLINNSTEEYVQDRNYIKKVAEKYLKNKERDIKTKQKAFRFLASRGYETEDIKWALDYFFKEDVNENWD